MPVTTEFARLVPIFWATRGRLDIMKRIAATIVGPVLTSFLFELRVYPAGMRGSARTGAGRSIAAAPGRRGGLIAASSGASGSPFSRRPLP